MSVSYLDLPLAIDSEGRLRTTFSDKRDDFNFPIVNLPFICSNIPAAPAHSVYDIPELVVPIRIPLIRYIKQWIRHNYILTRFLP
jgi:hypothetical protein